MAALSARQRKHVHMHSTIFSSDGPSSQSVYEPARMQGIYNDVVKPMTKRHSQKQVDVTLPRAGDMLNTLYAGNPGSVFPRPMAHNLDGAGGRPVLKQRFPSPDVLYHDGFAVPVVKARPKDAAIPKEFWQSSVNLRWDDARNETLRNRSPRCIDNAGDRLREEMSSEVLGGQRRVKASTSSARLELLAETADHFQTDSTFLDKASKENYDARNRCRQNLHSSSLNTIAEHMRSTPPAVVMAPKEDARRRSEKNFSDLLGVQMGERKDVRAVRQEMSSQPQSFLDMRNEITARRKAHWKPDMTSASDRKLNQSRSSLFEFQPKTRAAPPGAEAQRQSLVYRVCAEGRDVMDTKGELARRRVFKDHQKDFNDTEGCTPFSRKQDLLSSAEACQGIFRSSASPRSSGAARSPSPSFVRRTSGDATTVQSAKEAKLASFKSSVFS